MLISLILLYRIIWVYGVQEVKFYTGVLCDLQSRLANGCSKQVSDFNSLNACTFGCSQDPVCIGASVVNEDKNKLCFHHKTCNVTGCFKQEKDHGYMSKRCAHGGAWNHVKLACECVNGWVGEHCVDLPSKCTDLIDLGGYTEAKMYPQYQILKDARLQATKPIAVVCYVNPASEYHNLRTFANNGNVDFDRRSWLEYKEGFYVNMNNFWVGLYGWHALSLAGYTNLILVLESGTTYLDYRNFSVSDESKGFSFSLETVRMAKKDGVIGNTFPDCMGPLQNYPFSTIDNDQDGVTAENCARRVGSGWWFAGSCSSSPCNLLGKAPHDWAQFPSDQWMRFDGTDPELLNNADRSPLIYGYLRNIIKAN